MDYLDFELEVRPLGGRQYELIVIRSPAGETRAEAIFPLDTLQLENSLLKVEVALSRSSHSKRPDRGRRGGANIRPLSI